MKENFKQQLETNKVVTEQLLSVMKNKNYHNGDEIKVGDRIFFGMVMSEDESDCITLTMITLNENQIDLYELDDRYISDTFLPTIKLK